MEFYTTAIALKTLKFYELLDEPSKRRFAGLESDKLGHGGRSYIRDLLGCDFKTIKRGQDELGFNLLNIEANRLRKKGGGRKSMVNVERVNKIFLRILSKHTSLSKRNENLKKTYLNQEEIAFKMRGLKIDVSRFVISKLLQKHNYVKRK